MFYSSLNAHRNSHICWNKSCAVDIKAENCYNYISNKKENKSI